MSETTFIRRPSGKFIFNISVVGGDGVRTVAAHECAEAFVIDAEPFSYGFKCLGGGPVNPDCLRILLLAAVRNQPPVRIP